jgi:hypothetical protein
MSRSIYSKTNLRRDGRARLSHSPGKRVFPRLTTAFVLGTLIALTPGAAWAQACSCGGAPLLGALEASAVEGDHWHLGLGFESRSIADVVSGSEILDDDLRERSVRAGSLEISRGLSDRLSLAAVLTWLEQERDTAAAGGRDRLSTRGPGDALFLFKFSLLRPSLFSVNELALGAGVKAPLGRSDLRAGGTLIAADMQPGTGSWDGILWGRASRDLRDIARLNLRASASWRFNGVNERFGEGRGSYQFGNELTGRAGADYQPRERLDLSLDAILRRAGADRFAGVELPNSGGTWLDIEPGMGLRLSDGLAGRATLRLPLARWLSGTQLSTAFAFTLSFLFDFADPFRDKLD